MNFWETIHNSALHTDFDRYLEILHPLLGIRGGILNRALNLSCAGGLSRPVATCLDFASFTQTFFFRLWRLLDLPSIWPLKDSLKRNSPNRDVSACLRNVLEPFGIQILKVFKFGRRMFYSGRFRDRQTIGNHSERSGTHRH